MDSGDTPGSTFNNSFPDSPMDFDFMEEFFTDRCWIEATGGFNLSPENPSPFAASQLPPLYLPVPDQQDDTERKIVDANTLELVEFDKSSALSNPFLVEEGSELGRGWWFGPTTDPGPSLSVKDRLRQAIGYLKEFVKDRDFLIQIWVPVNIGGKYFLTTKQQPYSFNPMNMSLARYRDVSKAINFPAEADSVESAVGMPGRVFLAKLPEWTPDVRYFKSEEYPRIDYANKYDLRGALALPVFEGYNGTCLGVVEIITTTQKINYRPELENICKALEAVDLKGSHISIPQSIEVRDELYQAALPEIVEVLEFVRKSHRLPLALTWAPCARQGKSGCRHSAENYSRCVSTIDSACFVTDEDSRDFHDACSEHHLFIDQGIVGRAFDKKKQCFATDITAFSKTNYPLSHHARMIGLHAALAIPLHSVFSESVELVLELFLPKDCLDTQGQRQMLNLLSASVQQNFRSSYLVMDKELEEEVIFPVREVMTAGLDNKLSTEEAQEFSKHTPAEEPWIAHVMEGQRKGKGVSLSWEYQTEEAKEEFKVMDESKIVSPDKKENSGLKRKSDVNDGSSSSGGHKSLGIRKPNEKRRTKAEKTISLQVLQQYFAGSLKDAANSLGVCPTTLKRICRQHGITRWPSRKIKKVGHSLQKLQLVIDSVQGVEGSIQLGTFYNSFPELSSPTASPSLKVSNSSMQLNRQLDNGLFSHGIVAPKSPSSSGSQSSGSSTCCSTGNKQLTLNLNDPSPGNEDTGGFLKRARSDVQLDVLSQNEPRILARSKSHKIYNEQHPVLESLPPLPVIGASNLGPRNATIKIKVSFGEVKLRFGFQQNWGFKDLQQEIARRITIDDVSKIDLKYLDDDREWVLLTCDADLEECIDIYKSSQSRTIKIAVHQASKLKLGSSFGSSGPSQ